MSRHVLAQELNRKALGSAIGKAKYYTERVRILMEEQTRQNEHFQRLLQIQVIETHQVSLRNEIGRYPPSRSPSAPPMDTLPQSQASICDSDIPVRHHSPQVSPTPPLPNRQTAKDYPPVIGRNRAAAVKQSYADAVHQKKPQPKQNRGKARRPPIADRTHKRCVSPQPTRGTRGYMYLVW